MHTRKMEFASKGKKYLVFNVRTTSNLQIKCILDLFFYLNDDLIIKFRIFTTCKQCTLEFRYMHFHLHLFGEFSAIKETGIYFGYA